MCQYTHSNKVCTPPILVAICHLRSNLRTPTYFTKIFLWGRRGGGGGEVLHIPPSWCLANLLVSSHFVYSLIPFHLTKSANVPFHLKFFHTSQEEGMSIPLLRKVQSLGLQKLYQDDEFRAFINSVIALVFVPPTLICEGGLEGVKAFQIRDQFLEYFQDNWIEWNYPLCMWNMHSFDGPHTYNNAEGWH